MTIEEIDRLLASADETKKIIRDCRAEEEDKDYRVGYDYQMDNVNRHIEQLLKMRRVLMQQGNL